MADERGTHGWFKGGRLLMPRPVFGCGRCEMSEFLRNAGLLAFGFSVTTAGIFVVFYG